VLIGGAITLHNAPEGLAMGVAFVSGSRTWRSCSLSSSASRTSPTGSRSPSR
jgi:zinc transporter ZupT